MKRKIYLMLILAAVTIICLLILKKLQKSILATERAHINALTNQISVKTPATMQAVQTQANEPSVDSIQSPMAFDERIKRESEQEIAMWQAPILYYGKVVNESNQPISGVQVSYHTSAMNEFKKEIQNTGSVMTDERGIFKIDGVNGIGLMLDLSHPKFYSYPDNSTGFDKRALPRKGYFSDSEEKAELFRMHSKGNPVPLVHRRGGADVPVNTGQATVNFWGEQDGQVVGVLQIQAWGDTPKNWSPTPYDWSVQLSVPNGGFAESTNQFDFVAPNVGYQPTIKINMAKDQPGWSDTVVKTYFVKLASGYLRMGIRMRAKTPLYVSLDYYYNPDGSCNLESDK